MRFLFLFALLSSISFTAADHARADVSLLGNDGVALQIDGALDPTAEAIADADRRSMSATALYVSSTVLLATSAAGLLFGIPFAAVGALGSPGLAVGGIVLAAFGGLTFIGHVITMVLAVCYDVGSGARRRAAEEGRVALRATGGPGDVGAGLALDF